MPDIVISEHAHERMKERLGLPKSARQAAAVRAFLLGRQRDEIDPRLRKYLDGKREYEGSHGFRVYGNHVFVFTGYRLITVYEIPKHLRGGAGAA